MKMRPEVTLDKCSVTWGTDTSQWVRDAETSDYNHTHTDAE